MIVRLKDNDSLIIEFDIGYATVSVSHGHPQVTLTNYDSGKKELFYRNDLDFRDGIRGAIYIVDRPVY